MILATLERTHAHFWNRSGVLERPGAEFSVKRLLAILSALGGIAVALGDWLRPLVRPGTLGALVLPFLLWVVPCVVLAFLFSQNDVVDGQRRYTNKPLFRLCANLLFAVNLLLGVLAVGDRILELAFPPHVEIGPWRAVEDEELQAWLQRLQLKTPPSEAVYAFECEVWVSGLARSDLGPYVKLKLELSPGATDAELLWFNVARSDPVLGAPPPFTNMNARAAESTLGPLTGRVDLLVRACVTRPKATDPLAAEELSLIGPYKPDSEEIKALEWQRRLLE